MPLNLPSGFDCFIDANIVYYHFVETPVLSEASSDFLERVALGDLRGYTSTHAIAEAIHKVMIAEAALRFNLNRQGLVNWLQRHPRKIEELVDFRLAAKEIALMSLSILPADVSLFSDAAGISQSMHLLTNDALIVAAMRQHQLKNLVTNDDDFDGVDGITVWKPR